MTRTFVFIFTELAHSSVGLLPPRPFSLDGSFFGKNLSQIHLTPSGSYINLAYLLDLGPLHKFEYEVESKNDWNRQISFKPRLCEFSYTHAGVSNRGESSPEAYHDHETIENKSHPRAVYGGL